MGIVVEKPKINARGKRASYFVARTSNSTNAVEIYVGKLGETAAQVRARAIELLAQAAEERWLSARTVAPGLDGAMCDTWILSGDSVFGFEYGRVDMNTGRLRALTCFPAPNGHDALTVMLTHMADVYSPEQWVQFLFGPVDVNRFKAEIADRNRKRAEMVKTG